MRYSYVLIFLFSDSMFLLLLHVFFCICSSFNDKPINEGVVGPIGKELFEKEQDDLLTDLKDIPKKACDRRVSMTNLQSYMGGFGYCYEIDVVCRADK